MNRLKILLRKKQISHETFIFANKTIKFLSLNGFENFDPFITHLVIAIERIKDNQKVDKMKKEIYSDIKKNKNFNKAIKLYKKMFAKFNIKINQNEQEYIYLHLVNFLNQKEIEVGN